jgi:hypothetical protein
VVLFVFLEDVFVKTEPGVGHLRIRLIHPISVSLILKKLPETNTHSVKVTLSIFWDLKPQKLIVLFRKEANLIFGVDKFELHVSPADKNVDILSSFGIQNATISIIIICSLEPDIPRN